RRDDRHSDGACGQSACAGTLLAHGRHRHASWLLRSAAVRVVGRTELLLGRVAPVVRLLLRGLLVRVTPVRTGVSRRRVLLMATGPVTRLRRRRVPRVVRHVPAMLFLE